MKKIIKRIAGAVLFLFLAVGLIFWNKSRDYEYKLYLDRAEIVQYKGDDSNVVIPDRLWGLKITVLQHSAFKKNNIIESVKLPEYLEEISYDVFWQCENLENVEFGENIKRIRAGAFSCCTGLKEVSFSGKLVEIEDSAFYNCTNLKSVHLNEGLMKIGNQAFAGAVQLEDIMIPASVEKIDDFSFYNTNLKEVTFQGEKPYIGEDAFGNTPWEDSLE